jgi:primosomal protein N' (replication factor Y)
VKPKFARVIVDRVIQRELDYEIPETLAERVQVGSRVRVPFRDRSELATVVALLEETDASGVRPIDALVGDAPALNAKLLELARWMATYYCCSIETVMRSLLPQVIRRGEVGWKKQLFVQRGRAIADDELEKLRRRAPRRRSCSIR